MDADRKQNENREARSGGQWPCPTLREAPANGTAAQEMPDAATAPEQITANEADVADAAVKERAEAPDQARRIDLSRGRKGRRGNDAILGLRRGKQKSEEKPEKGVGSGRSHPARHPLRRVMIFSFLLPMGILAVAYACNLFYPIGNKTPLTVDLYHQYAPFLAEFRRKMLSGGSLFYTWNGGLGQNFYALFAYYLASPLNCLLLLFPPDYLSEAVTFLTLLKVGLIGSAFSCFLYQGFCPEGLKSIADETPEKTRYLSQTGADILTVIFASTFALSGFVLSYSWDIMWLDALICFPLALLGLLRLLRSGRFLLYTLSLALCLLVSYYIAFFVCVFTVLYFFAAYFSFESHHAAPRRGGRHFLLRLGQFAGASLLAGLIAAILVLPTYLALRGTSATADQFPQTFAFNFSIFDFLQRHLVAGTPDIREGLPNIYMGVLTFIAVPLYVFCREIRLKEKLWHLGLVFFMFLSFSNNDLDFLWHGMHYPNQLPFRYAFVYSALLIVICFRALTYLRSYSPRLIAVAGGLGALYAILAEEILKSKVQHGQVYLTLIFLLVYCVILRLGARSDAPERLFAFRTVCLILALTVGAELLSNALVSTFAINKNEYYTARSDFNNDFDDMHQALDSIAAQSRGFSRTEMIQQKTTNSPALYGYHGFTIFASTSNQVTAKLMRELGYHGNDINSYKYMASTSLMNAVYGIKYLINKEQGIADPNLRPLHFSGKGFIYENPLALPLGFMTDAGLLDWRTGDPSPFELQNDFARKGGGSSPVFLERKIDNLSADNYAGSGTAHEGLALNAVDRKTTGRVNLAIHPQRDEHIYFYLRASAETQVAVKVLPDAKARGSTSVSDTNTTLFSDSRSVNSPETFDCGFVRAGDYVDVELSTAADKTQDLTVYAAATDADALKCTVEGWRAGGMRLAAVRDGFVEGDVVAKEHQLLFLSIPYDKAWQAKVDGKPVQTAAIGGGLLGLPLAAGTHHITLVFVPQGFRIGLLLTLLGIGLTVLWQLLLCTRKKRRNQPYEIENQRIS